MQSLNGRLIYRVVTLCSAMVGLCGFAFAETRMVDDDGVQCPTAFSADIQSALNASIPGDEVVVCDGVYNENVVVPEGVSLTSQNGKDSTFILGVDTAVVGASVVTVNSNTQVVGFDISCATCTNGTIAGVGNSGLDSNIVVAGNRIHDLRDTAQGITSIGFEISGVRLFNVTDVYVWRNMIHDIDNVLNPSTFTSRARGIFVSGGPLESYRSKPEGTFSIRGNAVENITGFRAIGINVTRLDQDVAFGDLLLAGNTVTNIFDSGLILGSIGIEICEVEDLIDDVDVTNNRVRRVNTAFALRNSNDLFVTRNTVQQLNPIGNTINLVLDAIDFPGTGHDNVFCRNTLDAAGGILVGPEVFDNTFPFGRTFTFPFGLPDSPELGGDGTVEAANIRCNSRDFVCSANHRGGHRSDNDHHHGDDHGKGKGHNKGKGKGHDKGNGHGHDHDDDFDW